MRGCFALLFLCIFGLGSPARAQERGQSPAAQTDIRTAVADYCEAAGRDTSWCSQRSELQRDPLVAGEGGEYLPPSYFRVKYGIDVCDEDRTPAAVFAQLQASCGARSFGAAETLAVDLAVGLGKHIQAVATKQVIDFTVNEALKKLCATKIKTIEVSTLLAKSCGLTTESIDAITLSSLKAALREDLYSLPATLQVVAKNLIPDSPMFKVLGPVVFVTYEVLNRKPPLRILRDAYRVLVKAKVKCQMGESWTGDCLGLLAVAVGDAAADVHEQGQDLSLPYTLELGLTRFCANFAEPRGPDASCVIGHPDYGKIHTLVVPFLEAFDRLAKHIEAISEGSDDNSEAVLALKTLLHRVLDIVASDASLPASDKHTLALMRNVVDIVAGIAMKNPGEVRLQLLAALDNPHIQAKLPGTARRGLSFMLIVLGATDSDDVSKQLAAFAAPVGTYKMKFDREAEWTFAINAFIGPQVAAQWRFHETMDSGDGVEGQAYRIASPVGLDVTEPSGRFGFGVSVIDPLALTTITEEGKEDEADLASVLLFGGYARMAIGTSPFSVLVHGAYRPGFRSQDDCVVECFRGAFEVGGAIAVDVPLLILH
jgi:hypothetical protein